MEAWVARYSEADLLAGWQVSEMDFSGSTYQIEVFHSQKAEKCWTFLQFEGSTVKDAFCSHCPPDGQGGCLHLAVAYLKIFNHHSEPLHSRFESSFWHQLAQQLAEEIGYEVTALEKQAEAHYIYATEDFFLEIEALNPAARERLQGLMEAPPSETPETSIKFSQFSQEEISCWRAGRPSLRLRFSLSFWSDLAKWMMQLAEKSRESRRTVFFEEDREGLPTHCLNELSALRMRLDLRKSQLLALIPSLSSVDSSLKLFLPSSQRVASLRFDPECIAFYLSHTPLEENLQKEKRLPREILPEGEWLYLPGKGFYPKQDRSWMGREWIPEEACAFFLDDYTAEIARFLPVHPEPTPLSYAMHFDTQGNWHFIAYLFEKNDLLASPGRFLGNWCYLHEKGFYQVEKKLFEQVEARLAPHQVAHFIHHHRAWLNTQEGFQIHLARIESELSYSVTQEGVEFYLSKERPPGEMIDFGEWIYYKGQGFFLKKEIRLGLSLEIVPGLKVHASHISSFIKKHREDLESIPHFFTALQPLEARYLEIEPLSKEAFSIKPIEKCAPKYSRQDLCLFGEFGYLEGEGFFEVPSQMRLPEQYLVPRLFTRTEWPEFFEKQLPWLKAYVAELPPFLSPPQQMHLQVDSLERESRHGWRLQLSYQTDKGKISVSELLKGLNEKKRYLLSAAGLIDLYQEHYQWLRHQCPRFNKQKKSLVLTTMDLLRLDAFHNLKLSTEQSPYSPTAERLKELRTFSAPRLPSLTALKSTLRLYQKTGLEWLWFLYQNGLSGLLCDDMGLGKTHQAMALLAAILASETLPKRYLVVCPTSVIYHWQDKLTTFLPELSVHTFHGSRRNWADVPPTGLLLTSYGILRIEQQKFKELFFELAIFDEIQIAKNPQSRIHEALSRIRAEMRLGLSGTPIENNLHELKALFDLVLPNYLPSKARYQELFIAPIERTGDPEKRALLSQLIRPFILRRRKTEVLQELPEKSEDLSYCELSPEQRALYQETLTLQRDALLADLHNPTKPIDYMHIFALLARLKQICDHPALIHKEIKNHARYRSGKWDLFIELLEEARESQQKVVVFSQYLYMLDIMEQALQERGWGYAQIRGDTLNRKAELDRFQHDPNCLVFLGSIQAAGLGIDLTAASVVILFDRPWNAARENQAIDRVHRLGQKRGVQVYKLITKGTIEEHIDQMIRRKGQLLEEIVISDDQSTVKEFSREELVTLLSL